MNIAILISVLICSGLTLIALAVGAVLAPGMSRPELFFSVTVDPSLRHSSEGKGIRRDFNRSVILWSLAGLALMMAAIFARETPAIAYSLIALGYLTQGIGMTKSYLAARRRALVHQVAPSTEREAALASRPRFAAGSWQTQLGPFVILGLFSLWLWLRWDHIPARYPIHWGMDGKPNGWGSRTIGNVFMLPIVGAVACAFLSFLTQVLARGVRRIHSSGPEAQKESRNLRNIGRLMLSIQYWFAVMFGAMGLLPFLAKPSGPSAIVFVMAILSVLASVIIVVVVMRMGIKSGQGGWRLADGNKSLTMAGHVAPVGDRTPDACWKGGMIYYNPNDPAVWVEKRFGYGWTLNMATVRAWVILGALLLFGLAMPILSLFLLKK
jgi:uncharacterized membrane protein